MRVVCDGARRPRKNYRKNFCLWFGNKQVMGGSTVHVITTVVGALCACLVYYSVSTKIGRLRDPSERSLERRKLNASFVHTIATVVWPLILFNIVCADDIDNRFLGVPIVVHTLFWWLNMSISSLAADGNSSYPVIRLDGASLTGLALAVSSLCGNHPKSKYTYLFLYSVIACFLVVLPGHTLQKASVEADLFESIQRSVLWGCICSVITAAALTRLQLCGRQNESTL